MGNTTDLLSNLLDTLLPFFSIGDKNSALIASIFIGFLFAYFLYNILKFRWKVWNINKALNRITAEVKKVHKEDLVAKYENLFSNLKGNERFGHLWQEFNETIIKTRDENGNFKIYNTVDAQHLFNFNTLVKTDLNIRYYNAISGILTGLGLLGTFIGITAGLSAMPGAGASSTELTKAITDLLAGAKLAFSTSVWGIILSLIFNSLEKGLIKKLADSTRSLQSAIDSLFTKTGSEAILVDTLKESKSQTKQLKKFNNDLVFRIGDALDEAVSKNFKPVFDELLLAVEELKEVKEESATEAIGQMVDEFKGAMTAGANQQVEKMSDTLQQTAELLNDANQKTARDQAEMKELLNSHLSSFKENMDSIMQDLATQQRSSNKEMQESMGKILSRVEDGLEKTDKHFESLMNETQQNVNENLDGVKNLFEQLSEDFSTKIEGLTNRYDNERESLEQILDKVESQIKSFSESIENMDGISIKMREVVPRIEATSKNLSKSVENFSKSQQDMLETLVEVQQKYQNINTENDELLASIKQTLEKTQKQWSAYESRFDNLREELNGVFSELQNGLSEYQSKTKGGLLSNLKDFDGIMSNAVRNLSGGVDELREVLEEMEVSKNGHN